MNTQQKVNKNYAPYSLATVGFCPIGHSKTYTLPINLEGVKVGDVLRTDGLPFLTRPSLKLRKQKLPNNWQQFKPTKLLSGYWVLRQL